MKKLIFLSLLLGLPLAGMAAGGAPLEHVKLNMDDQAALQRGAKLFVNYCLGCHSAAAMRYKRLTDLGLTEEEIQENLIFTGQKVGEPMISSMDPKAAKDFFGKAPPDLSVIARSRGIDWLYTYLKSFYKDPARPVGWNNTVFPNASMPNVMASLQGVQVARHEKGEHGEKIVLELAKTGSRTPEQFDRDVKDLVSYLAYMGEPAQLLRKKYGPYVIGFLLLFTLLAYLMKKEYWRDIH